MSCSFQLFTDIHRHQCFLSTWIWITVQWKLRHLISQGQHLNAALILWYSDYSKKNSIWTSSTCRSMSYHRKFLLWTGSWWTRNFKMSYYMNRHLKVLERYDMLKFMVHKDSIHDRINFLPYTRSKAWHILHLPNAYKMKEIYKCYWCQGQCGKPKCIKENMIEKLL